MQKERLLVSSTKYTLDRFEGDFAVFLLRPDETEQLLIPRFDIDIEVVQGDIVTITQTETGYTFTKETEEVNSVMERLKQLRARLNRKNL